jgi:hypothetical protein
MKMVFQKILAGIGLIVIIIAVLAFTGIIIPNEDDKADEIINNIYSLDREITYSIEDITKEFDLFIEEEFATQGSIDRGNDQLSNVRESLTKIESEVEAIKEEIKRIETLSISEEYNFVVVKLSESYENYRLFAESSKEAVEKMDITLLWATHYVKVGSYMEDIITNDEMAAIYIMSEDYVKVEKFLMDIKKKATLAENEISEALDLIEFSFSRRQLKAMNYYGKYADSSIKGISYLESWDFLSAEDSFNDALDYSYMAYENLPTESEIDEEVDKWYNKNLNDLTNLADSYEIKATRAYNEAIEIYNSL